MGNEIKKAYEEYMEINRTLNNIPDIDYVFDNVIDILR